MSVDFQVVFPSEVIELTSVRMRQGAPVPTLDITGKDFTSIDEVLVNDVASPNLMVVSKNRVFAEVPEQAQSNLANLRVLVISRKLTITPRSLIQFKVGKTPSKVRGILKLVQVFLKILFTTPGSDIFSPRVGVGALKNIGKTFGQEQTGNIVSDFIVAVDSATRQLVGIQARDPSIPIDEKLLSAKVRSANFDPNQAALLVSVELTSQTGQAAQTNLVV